MRICGAAATLVLLLAAAACSEEEDPPAPTWIKRAASWSPDGRRIAFQFGPKGRGAIESLVVRPRQEIWIVDADGSDARRLVRGTTPSWSHDGRTLVYERWSGLQSDIARIDVRNPDPYLLTRTDADEHNPKWSPSDSEIAFISERSTRDFPGQLFVIRPDGSGQRRLTTKTVVEFAWSPSGRELAFATCCADERLYVIRRDGSRLRDLGPAAVEESLSWSPSGDKLAHSGPAELGRFVYVTTANGGEVGGSRRSTSGDPWSVEVEPEWSPDGRLIAFARICCHGTGPGIYVISPDGSSRRRLTKSGSGPDWSPDGQRIAFADGEIYVARPDGSGARPVTTMVRQSP
jgi:Tol biopolymer transport system component